MIRKYGVILSQYDGFLMVCVQNVCRKAAFTSLYPILTGVVYASSPPRPQHQLEVKGVLNHYMIFYISIVLSVAKSADPDEMPHFAASHLGLHCL